MVSFQRVCLINATILEEEFTKCHLVLVTGSSASMFSNEDTLTNVDSALRFLKLDANGGEIRTNKIGTFCDLRAWLSAEPIANTLTLFHATGRHRVVMDSENYPGVKVEILSGTWMRFALNEVGLCVHDVRENVEFEHSNTDDTSSHNTKQQVKNYLFVQTAEKPPKSMHPPK